MKSVMMHQFSRIARANIPRSLFKRNFGHLTTFPIGKLIPIYLDEALPGDTISLNMSGFFRMNTPVAPIMDNIYLDVHFFGVANRLVWENWEKFCGAQTDPGDSTDYEVPKLAQDAVNALDEDDLANYFGVPIGQTSILDMVSALPFRAYELIWNSWYRDENLQDSEVVAVDDGPDSGYGHGYVPLPRGKRHDYFTSALPWPQKGEEVTIPLGTTADVLPGTEHTTGAHSAIKYRTTAGGTFGSVFALGVNTSSDGVYATPVVTSQGGVYPTNLQADLENATAATINALRLAFQVQKLLERDARGGTRYQEVVLSHFGVMGADARLQRPEYLGGGTIKVNINPVTQTSETNATPQGNMSAFGTAQCTGIGFTKSFSEHCLLLGLISGRADLRYQQGIDRMLMRTTRYDFYWPALSHLGEQEVLNAEIYADGSANDDDVFGYQERYAEYRYKNSIISGHFRSDAAAPYDYYHLGQQFGALPVLNASFIVEDPPMSRIMAVPGEPDFLADTFFSIRAARPIPMYGTPGLIDHF